MSKTSKREAIEVWRHAELPGVEFRRGIAVADPYPRHWHDEYQVCLITDGGGSLHYRGARRDTPTASLFIVHPGEIHSNETATGCSFQSVYIEPGVVTRFGRGMKSVSDVPFFGNEVIFDQDLVSTFQALHSTQGITPLEREFLLQSFVIGLTSRFSVSTLKSDKCDGEPSVVRVVRDYIIDNHARGIALSELEKVAGLSGFHLTRVFSNAVGMPPHAFQTHVRVVAAKELIRRGLAFAEAAVMVGFSDQSHFHRHFLRLMKVTPGDYFKNRKNVQY